MPWNNQKKTARYLTALCVGIIALAALSGAAGAVTIDFEPPFPKGLKPTASAAAGAVSEESRVYRQYQAAGILFKDAALLYSQARAASAGAHGIVGINAAGEPDAAASLSFSFVDPDDASRPMITDYVAVTTAAGAVKREMAVTVKAYDTNGTLLETATHKATGSGWDGATLEVRSAAGIHAVVIEQSDVGSGIPIDRLTFEEPVPAPLDVTVIWLAKRSGWRFDAGAGDLLPVAVLGHSTFSALEVDPATCLVAGRGVRFDDGRYAEHIEDVNLDGYPDLVMQIDTEDQGLDWRQQAVSFTGNLFDGRSLTGTVAPPP